MSDNREPEVLPGTGTREAAITTAQELLAQLSIPPGFRVVLAVTDETGAFVGVHSNVCPVDTEAILVSAVYGAERLNGE
jgi:hypothetical protein